MSFLQNNVARDSNAAAQYTGVNAVQYAITTKESACLLDTTLRQQDKNFIFTSLNVHFVPFEVTAYFTLRNNN